MAARGSKNSQRQRADAERARLYAARTDWHQAQIRRRFRDNLIVGVVGSLLVIGALASQAVHATTIVPEPTPTPTPVNTTAPIDPIVPTPAATDTVVPTTPATPAPTPTSTPAE